MKFRSIAFYRLTTIAAFVLPIWMLACGTAQESTAGDSGAPPIGPARTFDGDAATDAPPEADASARVAIALGLTAGDGHTCAVRADGTVACWGANYRGQLGSGTTTDSPTPVTVHGLLDVAGLSGGGDHTCARKTDGTVACWGDNNYGQLGTAATGYFFSTPVPVPALPDVRSLAAGFSHTCAVEAGGAVFCWGRNDYDQLGSAPTGDGFASAPVAVAGLTGVTSVVAGTDHTCARKADGTVVCWGINEAGELGDGAKGHPSGPPLSVVGLADVTSLAAGDSHTCARKSDGTVACWGHNRCGQLGSGSTLEANTPVAVPGLTGVVMLAAGRCHTCAGKTDGTLVCWGANDEGQLGNGTFAGSLSPVAVLGMTNVTMIAAGDTHTCARAGNADGSVYCWGNNGHGQLGDGKMSIRQSTIPTLVRGL